MTRVLKGHAALVQVFIFRLTRQAPHFGEICSTGNFQCFQCSQWRKISSKWWNSGFSKEASNKSMSRSLKGFPPAASHHQCHQFVKCWDMSQPSKSSPQCKQYQQVYVASGLTSCSPQSKQYPAAYFFPSASSLADTASGKTAAFSQLSACLAFWAV